MTKGKSSTDSSTTHGMTATILTAIAGIITAFLTAYFGYRAGVDAIQIPLRATQTAEAKSTPVVTAQATKTTPAIDKGVSIKSMPSLYIAPFGDSDDTVRGDLFYKLIVIHNRDGGVNYKFEYNLPSSGFGYAGFQFVFDHPQILEDYKFIEIDIMFGDAATGCNLKLRDNSGKSKESRILGPNQPFRIPIETATEGLNLEGIKSIEFIALTDFSTGYHIFTVSDVRLVK